MFNPKRLITIGISFLTISSVLIGRLFYIQIMMNEDYTKRAVNQRMIKIPVSSNRGEILDKNGIPFTDREYEVVLLAYPDYISDKNSAVELISKISEIDKDKVLQKLNEAVGVVEFRIKTSNQIINLVKQTKLRGIMIVEKTKRYSSNGLARHIIGKIDSSNKGESGLEKKFDKYLSGSGTDSVVAVVDSGKNLIPGLGIRRVQSKNSNITLTIDYHIQRKLEQILDDNKVNGCAVIMDIKNGDIVGMASRPNFTQLAGQKMLNDTQDYLNKAVNNYNMGSTFKAVVAAAALEEGKIDLNEKFKCEGEITIGDKTVKCSTYGSHKNTEINVYEAFAYSCNSTFIKIGMRVGSKKIIEMAKKFGFGEPQLTIRENKESINILNEASGQLPDINDGISNISIGQGSLLVTPVQVTCMTAIIANNGIKYSPRLVDSIATQDGLMINKFKITQPEVIISPDTANILKQMMRQVTINGTGAKANLDEFGGSSGKTGTAEAGNITHAWFSGFVPSSQPKYAITIFIYGGKSGGGNAAPIFKQVATEVLKLNIR